MCVQENSFILKVFLDWILKNILSNMGINSCKRVIKEIYVRIRIKSSCKWQPRFLSPTDINTSFPNLCINPVNKLFNILFQIRHFNHDIHSILIKLSSKCYKLSNGPAENYGFLFNICNHLFLIHYDFSFIIRYFF